MKSGWHVFKSPFCPEILFSNMFEEVILNIPCSVNQENTELVCLLLLLPLLL